MTMQMPLATVGALLGERAGRVVELHIGPHRVVADSPQHGTGEGPKPVELMTASLAACSVMSARTYLEREGNPGDIEVVVTLDGGPPTVLYRRVLLGFRLDRTEAHRLCDVLERTEVTMMLKPAFTIRTQIEHAGEPLN
jgi:uncharacterized OsmC-like protein